MAKPIGTLGVIDTISVGGVVFTDLSTIIVLQGSCVTATGSNSTCRKPGATSGYQVTTGKTYTIRAIAWSVKATNEVGLLYADADVGTPSGTGFTNPIYWSGDSANQQFILQQTSGTGQSGYGERAIWFPVAALKYVGLTSNTASGIATITTWGYEA